MAYHSSFWPNKFKDRELLLLLTDLITKVTNDGTKIMLKISEIAVDSPWCQELLEYIFVELEYRYLQELPCPLLANAVKNDSKIMLWKSCCSQNQFDHQTAVRLILLVCKYLYTLFLFIRSVLNLSFFVTANSKYSLIYHQTIAELLSSTSDMNYNCIGSLVRIINGPGGTLDVPDIKPGIELSLEKFIFHDNRNKSLENSRVNLNILKNLVYILRLEKKQKCVNLKMRTLSIACEELITKLLNIFKNLMDQVGKDYENANSFLCNKNERINQEENDTKKIKMEVIDVPENKNDEKIMLVKEQIHILVKLFDILEIGRKEMILDVSDVLKMTHLIVKYFFWNLTERNSIIRLTAMNNTYSILSRIRKQRTARSTALKDLLEGSLYIYGNLFGAENDDQLDTNKTDELLITLNQRLGVVSNTNRSILHAGVIGRGIRTVTKQAKLPETEIQNMLLKAITACCKDEVSLNKII